VGKTYECEGKIVLCENGFHFCEDPKQYPWLLRRLDHLPLLRDRGIRGDHQGDGKCVCSKITIVREIPLQEFLALVNEGSRNTGWANEGDSNKGDSNEGELNKGDCEQGRTATRATGTRATELERATGTRATGTRATGTRATGTRATRTRATRTRATGTGDWNKGNGTSVHTIAPMERAESSIRTEVA
jgi:hypothetical protein